MTRLTILLNQEEDARKFKDLYDETYQAFMEGFWLDGRNFAYSRDSGMNEDPIDTRPALDALLRWAWLELADPRDEIVTGYLNMVLKSTPFVWCRKPLILPPEWTPVMCFMP